MTAGPREPLSPAPATQSGASPALAAVPLADPRGLIERLDSEPLELAYRPIADLGRAVAAGHEVVLGFPGGPGGGGGRDDAGGGYATLRQLASC